MSKLQRDFTKGPIGRELLSFSIPFLLANLLQALYGAVDMLVVGNFASPDPAVCTAVLSGVNIGGQITHMLTMMVSGLTVAGTVMLGQYIGADKPEEGRKTVGTTLTLLFLLAVAFTVVMLLLSGPILRLLQTPAESFAAAQEYLNICLVGTVFIFGYNAISAIQRGMGDSVRPLIFVGIACLVNVFLDLWFVKGLMWGAAGAAWATVIAQAISLIIAAVYLARNRFIFDFKLSSFKIHRDKAAMMFKLGIPSSVQSIIVNISFLIMTALVNVIGGVTASAAVGVVGKLNGFGILPAVAMSSSVSAFAAQNIGARRYDRARKSLLSAIMIAMTCSLVIFAALQLFPTQIIGIFAQDADTVLQGVTYVRAYSYDYLLVPVLFCLNGLIMGAGHTGYTLLTGAVSSILLRIPLAYVLGRGDMGLTGVGVAAPLASLGGVVLAAWFVLTNRWMRDKTGISGESA